MASADGRKATGPLGVIQIIDSLEAGGLERVAVNLANLLPQHGYRSYLCTTRRDGPLADLVADDVVRLRLQRRSRFDARGVRRLISFVASHDISILHAHGSALFIAAFASLFHPHPSVVWHVHYGRYAFDDRPRWLYQLVTRRVKGVISVNRPLADWARSRLRVPSDRVWYIPNFALPHAGPEMTTELPGRRGARIVCVANLRPVKDHHTLIAAMVAVAREVPEAHLLLVGGGGDAAYRASLLEAVHALGLGDHISFLGHREDVAAILRASDVGVLSSRSEGFPLALVEYGSASLACVSTTVGQCGEILADGEAGLLVSPADPAGLAEQLIALLRSPARRRELGERLQARIERLYAPGPIMAQICDVYQTISSDFRP